MSRSKGQLYQLTETDVKQKQQQQERKTMKENLGGIYRSKSPNISLIFLNDRVEKCWVDNI